MVEVQFKNFSELKDPRWGSDSNQALKVLHLQGWMGKYSPLDHHPCKVAKSIGPVLVSGLASETTPKEVEEACAVFGAVKHVHIPSGQRFAFVTMGDDSEAAKLIEGLAAIGDAPVKVQPGKMASKEVSAWRASLKN